MTFCKRILGVKSSTCNMAIYGDLGGSPLYIDSHELLNFGVQLFILILI